MADEVKVWQVPNNQVMTRRLLPEGFILDADGNMVKKGSNIAIASIASSVGGSCENYEGEVVAIGPDFRSPIQKGTIIKFRKFSYTVYKGSSGQQYIPLTDKELPTLHHPNGRDGRLRRFVNWVKFKLECKGSDGLQRDEFYLA